jgi:NAD(P)-dependent dehydrogenase (short-subunit alcohol dehydrogenase family)
MTGSTSVARLPEGAGMGLGRMNGKSVLKFADEGARLIVQDVQADPVRALASELSANGAKAHAVVGDVSRDEDCRAMVQAAVDAYGRLDVAVANAGIIPLGDVLESTAEDWDQVMSIDGRGMFLTCKYAIDLRPGQVRRNRHHQAPRDRVGGPGYPGQCCSARHDQHRASAAPAGGAGRTRVPGGDQEGAPDG